jgi:UDP-GlcNAc:undecaprenyl-phosphate/decaprenyl-phosphate GlcNAc-1-phosphate transferase
VIDPSAVAFAKPFLAAAAAAVIVTPIVRAVAVRLGALAAPRRDRWHRRPVPLLGGAAICLSVLAVAAALIPLSGLRALAPVVLAGAGVFAVGAVDDWLHIKPASKLTGQIFVGCFAIVAGVSSRWTGSPAIDALISLAWFVGITNAFNLIDNMDGLCAGVATIAALSICASAADPTAPAFIYSAALAGVCLGFLAFNFSPASIFMGDSGSLFVGATLALLSLDPRPELYHGPLAALAVPVLLLLVPIFDTVFVTVSRGLASRSAAVGGRDHTSHRLVALGFSERQAVVLLYGLAATAGGVAVALERARVREANIVMGLLLVVLTLLGVQLARVRVYGDADFSALRDKAFTPILIEMTYKRRVFEVLLDLALVTLAYYGAYVIRFDPKFTDDYGLFVASLPVVIACQLSSFFVAGVYRGVWRYFSGADVLTYVKAVALGSVTSVLALLYLYRFVGYSRSVFLIDAMALLLLLVGSRYSFRLVSDLTARRRPGTYRVIVYGAGEGGALLVGELLRNQRYDYQVLGFIDDDDSKVGKRLAGLQVFGGIERLTKVIAEHAVDLVIISTEKVAPGRIDRLQRICFESGTGILQFDFRLRPLVDARSPAPGDVDR